MNIQGHQRSIEVTRGHKLKTIWTQFFAQVLICPLEFIINMQICQQGHSRPHNVTEGNNHIFSKGQKFGSSIICQKKYIERQSHDIYDIEK